MQNTAINSYTLPIAECIFFRGIYTGLYANDYGLSFVGSRLHGWSSHHICTTDTWLPKHFLFTLNLQAENDLGMVEITQKTYEDTLQ